MSNNNHNPLRTFDAKRGHYRGVDGFRLAVDAERVWAWYHLLRGGYPETDYLELESLTGIPAELLARTDAQSLFLSCDNTWLRIDRGPANLIPGRAIVCRGCGRSTSVVPCQWCAALGRPVDWDRSRRPGALFGGGPTYRSLGSRAIDQSERNYNG